MNLKQFGGKITDKLKARYEQSPQWIKGKFRNLQRTKIDVTIFTLPSLIYKQISESKGRMPKVKIPVHPFDHDTFIAPSANTKIIWYGHSVVLLRINGLNVLIDPMLGPDASPIAPFRTPRFSENTLDIIDQLPPIDLVLLTHDHYDHLDYASIQKLKSKTTQYYTSLGLARHLHAWGIPPSNIVEFDWWDDQIFEGLHITFTPTRHASGRGISDQSQCLWGGWAIRSEHESIYFSGDGGYGEHFELIGDRLGPFDFGLMECGQYNDLWRQIHMFPEESVLAALDVGAKRIMPVHWAGFALAQHHWTDAVTRFVQAAEEKGVAWLTPQIGELFHYHEDKQEPWWEAISQQKKAKKTRC